jgi:hypothetical protein
MKEDIIGQFRIFGENQKHRFGQTLSASSLEDNQHFLLFRFPPFRVLTSQSSRSEALITQWNQRLRGCLHRLVIIENSLVSIHPFIEGVWLNSSPPLSISHALQVFQQVGRQLASIHERGWTHGMLEVDHILLDYSGEPHLITPPLSWLYEILQDYSSKELAIELSGEALPNGVPSVSTDVSCLLRLVYRLFVNGDGGELMSDARYLRENLREEIPLQLEMVLTQLSDVSQRDSIRSVRQLMELISGCFSPRLKRRGATTAKLRDEETHDAAGSESHENSREEPQLPRKLTGKLMSQSVLFINSIESFFAKMQVRLECLVGLCTTCIAQWVSLLSFLTPLRVGALAVGLCSFIMSVSLPLRQASNPMLEPVNLEWEVASSHRSSEITVKNGSYALTVLPLPKFFEEYGSDEYGEYIEQN